VFDEPFVNQPRARDRGQRRAAHVELGRAAIYLEMDAQLRADVDGGRDVTLSGALHVTGRANVTFEASFDSTLAAAR
jgi:hypothetical protein